MTKPLEGHVARLAAGEDGTDQDESNSAGKWTGIYFKGVPIRVTAVPKPGHEFHRWEAPEDFDVSTESLGLNLMDEARLKAAFLAPE